MPNFQEAGHGIGHDYGRAPHLRHASLRGRIESSLSHSCSGLGTRGSLAVLEIGAGHGPFTPTLLSLGAHVTMTEMSKPAVDRLKDVFAREPRVKVIHDAEGLWPFETDRQFDAVVCVSVLHHIPDYLQAIRRYAEITRPGGAFISWQDPLWYSRLPFWDRLAAQVAYYWCRLPRGEWQRGARTLSRRVRGILDESEESDMVEYHVVRNGVDEEAIQEFLISLYGSVAIERYWSTQSVWWQRWGERRGLVSSFGSVATHRRGKAAPIPDPKNRREGTPASS
jgi:SAM-dependent methyltransferase